MNRVSILIVTILIGAAAPARAWCEATCLAPAHESHCPSHDESSDRAAMSAASTADCPAVEAARPIQAKLDFALALVAVAGGTAAPTHSRTLAFRHQGAQAHRHLTKIPLRI